MIGGANFEDPKNQLLCKSSVKMRLKSKRLKLSLQGRKDHGSGHATSPPHVLRGLPNLSARSVWRGFMAGGSVGSELCFVNETPISTKRNLVACKLQGITPWESAGPEEPLDLLCSQLLSTCQLLPSNCRPTSSLSRKH